MNALKYTLCSISSPLPAGVGTFLLMSSMLVAADNIAQSPLMLSANVPPNLILTIDNSSSMTYSFAPDGIAWESRNTSPGYRRTKSSYYNALYYNPEVTYKIPPRYDSSGVLLSPYSTSFSNAPNNGFKQGGAATGSVDLSSQYLVSSAYNPESGPGSNYNTNGGEGSFLSANPASDFSSVSGSVSGVALIDGQTSAALSSSSTFSFKITKSAGGCSVQFETGAAYASTSCKQDGPNAYTVKGNVAENRMQKPVPAYYYVYDVALSGCPVSPATDSARMNDERCYRLVFVSSTSGVLRADDQEAGVDERQNFAIWYSFYRNRLLSTMSAAALAFAELPSSVRLTWQAITGSECITLNSSNCQGGENYFSKFSGVHRGQFFKWISSVKYGSGTPLREAMAKAGDFLKANDAWAENPNPISLDAKGKAVKGNTETGTKYSCRPSYHIMMTDGAWGGAFPSGSFNRDETAVVLPDAKQYDKKPPYYDAAKDTLADVAFNYWATDLSSLDNDLKPVINAPNSADLNAQYWDPKNDPATWQHMVTFTIGLGLSSGLNDPRIPWAGSTYAGEGYKKLMAGSVAWPDATTMISPENNASVNYKIYDLWHAAINSRGQFFSADSPETVVDAFARIINMIGGGTTSNSSPAVKLSQSDDSISGVAYTAQFTGDDWSGDLIKYSIGANGEKTKLWGAKDKLPSSRNIKMFSADGVSKLKDFEWGNLDDMQRAMLNRNADDNGNVDAEGASRISYLKGSRAKEGKVTGTFRQRGSGVLGDIVNSSPVLVGAPSYWTSFADGIEGAASYGSFKSANANRQPVVYVGANDGMLHAFNANTGVEMFAFVPSAVIPDLYRLTAQNYNSGGHHFYVDGAIVMSDVYFDEAWHTVLVGTLGAGGKSLFALDITDPENIRLLWENTYDANDETGLASLGYTLPRPYIARLYSGQWAVVTGNGYSGTENGQAALMIFDMKTGAVLKSLAVVGDTSKPNGLSSVMLSDYNSDGVAEYAYAGDLQGNLWRFDLFPTSVSSSDSIDPFKHGGDGGISDSSVYTSQFKVSYGGKPMYSAKSSESGTPAQPITAPPVLVRHPTSLGYLVIFGAGKYFETGDSIANHSQSMSVYGIWDRQTKGQSTSTPNPVLSRANLVSQSFSAPDVNDFSASFSGLRLLSANTVQWYGTGDQASTVNKWGWVLDLKVGSALTGEMVVQPLKIRGSTLLVDTLLPPANPCSDDAGNWLYGINPYTGGRTSYNVFDLNGDNVIDVGDTAGDNVVSGLQVSSYGTGGGVTVGDTIFRNDKNGPPGVKFSSGPQFNGRQSWQVTPEEAH